MKTILIVEDNKTQIKIFDKVISAVDVKTLSLNTGKELISFLNDKISLPVKKGNISLILLDFYLEDQNAIQILSKIKNNKIPVAILSADKNMENIVESIKAGADNFFIKGEKDELVRLYSYINKL